MIGTELLVASGVLALSVSIGLIAHEWSHALVLRLAGIEHDVVYVPGRDEGVVAALASCRWAAVHPRPDGTESPWVFRLAAMMPLVLTLPVLGVALTGTLRLDDPIVVAAALGVLACAIPSPQDFSVAFYAHRLLERERFTNGSRAE